MPWAALSTPVTSIGVAVGVGVVGQDVDRGGVGVLVDGEAVVVGDGLVVDGRDRHVDGGGVAVGDGVGERVGAVVVGVGLCRSTTPSVRVDGAVGGVADVGDLDGVALDVGVVGQDVDRGGGGVLVDGDAVVDRDGACRRPRSTLIVDGGGVAVGDRVGERVGAVVVGVGRVGDTPSVRVTVPWAALPTSVTSMRVAVGVGVVGQDVDPVAAASSSTVKLSSCGDGLVVDGVTVRHGGGGAAVERCR